MSWKTAPTLANLLKINSFPSNFQAFHNSRWQAFFRTPDQNFSMAASLIQVVAFNLIQDGHFRGCSQMGMGGGKKAPLPKICHTCPTSMKLGTVIPYLKKIQKIYQSRGTRPDFCWHQHFLTGNQQILLYQEIQI